MNKRPEDHRTGLEIAVIGMACRFPGAENLDEFWDNLKNGVESITFFSDEELTEAGIATELLTNPNYVKAKPYPEDSEYFDAAFFEYSPKEAEVMDSQFRVFHECVWHALEHAGYNPLSYKGLIGLIDGMSSPCQFCLKSPIYGKRFEVPANTGLQTQNGHLVNLTKKINKILDKNSGGNSYERVFMK